MNMHVCHLFAINLKGVKFGAHSRKGAFYRRTEFLPSGFFFKIRKAEGNGNAPYGFLFGV